MNVENTKALNMIDDISNITTIPVASLQKLNDKLMWCICNAVEEAKLKNDSIVNLNIGIGNQLKEF